MHGEDDSNSNSDEDTLDIEMPSPRQLRSPARDQYASTPALHSNMAGPTPGRDRSASDAADNYRCWLSLSLSITVAAWRSVSDCLCLFPSLSDRYSAPLTPPHAVQN